MLVAQVGFNIMAENKPVLRVDISVDAVLSAWRACVEAVELKSTIRCSVSVASSIVDK